MKPPVALLEPDWIAKLSAATKLEDLPDEVPLLQRLVCDLRTLAQHQRLERQQLQELEKWLGLWLSRAMVPAGNKPATPKRQRKRRRRQ
jgi:hypothetical protein